MFVHNSWYYKFPLSKIFAITCLWFVTHREIFQRKLLCMFMLFPLATNIQYTTLQYEILVMPLLIPFIIWITVYGWCMLQHAQEKCHLYCKPFHVFSARSEADGSCLHIPVLIIGSCNNTSSFEGCYPHPARGLPTTPWLYSYCQQPLCSGWGTGSAQLACLVTHSQQECLSCPSCCWWVAK